MGRRCLSLLRGRGNCNAEGSLPEMGKGVIACEQVDSLFCASLLNRGTTVLRHVARIEEVNRILEVLNSIGVKTRWFGDNDLEIIPPAKLKLESMDIEAAKKTRSIIMFLGPLMHRYKSFELPYAGGCTLGERTVEPHLQGLEYFGLNVDTVTGHYAAISKPVKPEKAIVFQV